MKRPSNNPNHDSAIDLTHGVPLERIPLVSLRAQAYYARNKDQLNDFHIHFAGAIDMLDGMDYHFSNLEEVAERTLKNPPRKANGQPDVPWQEIQKCKHELVAVLNRLYQFHEFYNAKHAKPHIGGVKRSNIDLALKFRHHLTGKRLLDYGYHKMDDAIKDEAIISDMSAGIFLDEDRDISIYLTTRDENNLHLCLQKQYKDIAEECYSIFIAVHQGLAATRAQPITRPNEPPPLRGSDS